MYMPKGKVNRRLDFSLSVLFRIEEDNFFNYRRKCQLPMVARDEATCYLCAIAIPAGNVEFVKL